MVAQDPHTVVFPDIAGNADVRSQLKKYTQSLCAWLQPQTSSYRSTGEDTLTYGDQRRWVQVKWLIATAPHRHTAGSQILDTDLAESVQFLKSVEEWMAHPTEQAISIYDRFASAFAQMISHIANVESVVYEPDHDSVKIWIVVNDATELQRYGIYDQQWNIMQLYPEVIADFVIFDRHGGSLADLTEWGSLARVVRK